MVSKSTRRFQTAGWGIIEHLWMPLNSFGERRVVQMRHTPFADSKTNIDTLKGVLRLMRLPFLVLTPTCVMLGVGTAVWSDGPISVFYAILTLVGAVCAHICVNSLNEYLDFRNGLDFRTVRTPFSGGSGVLPSQPQLAHVALTIALVALIFTGLVGLFFVAVRGLALVPVGIMGLALIVAYTRYLTRHPWLCLVAPGLGFGPVMVLGTHFVLTGQYSGTALLASLIPFFLVNNLLLLNQFPDVEADMSVGRKNFPITIGRQASCHIFCAFIVLAYLMIPLGVGLTRLPAISLITLAGLLVAIPTVIGVYRYAEATAELTPFAYMNLAVTIFTPLLLSLALFLDSIPSG